VWSYGEEVYRILTDQLALRERLRPYIHEQMKTASLTGVAMMRPLFVDFPLDDESWAVDDEFMCGPDLLVAPVITAGTREREVYLPAGARWTHAWTGATFDGGQKVKIPAPLESIPVFLRDQAQVPITG
jgi:alpha-D-xyloside xylohydrolase